MRTVRGVRRSLILFALMLHVVFIGAVVILVGRFVTHSWVWGCIAAVGAIGVYVPLALGTMRLVRAHPEAARRYMESWGRGRQVSLGGWDLDAYGVPRNDEVDASDQSDEPPSRPGR